MLNHDLETQAKINTTAQFFKTWWNFQFWQKLPRSLFAPTACVERRSKALYYRATAKPVFSSFRISFQPFSFLLAPRNRKAITVPFSLALHGFSLPHIAIGKTCTLVLHAISPLPPDHWLDEIQKVMIFEDLIVVVRQIASYREEHFLALTSCLRVHVRRDDFFWGWEFVCRICRASRFQRVGFAILRERMLLQNNVVARKKSWESLVTSTSTGYIISSPAFGAPRLQQTLDGDEIHRQELLDLACFSILALCRYPKK